MRPALTHAFKTQLIFRQSLGQAGVQTALLACRLCTILRFGPVAFACFYDDELIRGAEDFSRAASQKHTEYQNEFFHRVLAV